MQEKGRNTHTQTVILSRKQERNAQTEREQFSQILFPSLVVHQEGERDSDSAVNRLRKSLFHSFSLLLPFIPPESPFASLTTTTTELYRSELGFPRSVCSKAKPHQVEVEAVAAGRHE